MVKTEGKVILYLHRSKRQLQQKEEHTQTQLQRKIKIGIVSLSFGNECNQESNKLAVIQKHLQV